MVITATNYPSSMCATEYGTGWRLPTAAEVQALVYAYPTYSQLQSLGFSYSSTSVGFGFKLNTNAYTWWHPYGDGTFWNSANVAAGDESGSYRQWTVNIRCVLQP